MRRRHRVAIYVRVSRDDQLTINQERELRDWCERAGHEVVQKRPLTSRSAATCRAVVRQDRR